MKKFCNFFHSYVVGCFQTSFRRSEYLAYLAVFHFVVVTELENSTLHIGQAGNCFLQLRLCLVAIKVAVGHEMIGQSQVGIISAQGGPVFLPAGEVEGFIDGDACEPCDEL